MCYLVLYENGLLNRFRMAHAIYLNLGNYVMGTTGIIQSLLLD